jgi:hypothetical protein
MQRIDGLKSAIARHNSKVAQLEAKKSTTPPAQLPALHREIASLAEVGAALHEALAVGEIVLTAEQAKLDAARDACINSLSQVLSELQTSTSRFDRAAADLRAAVASRRSALEKLRPLMLGSVDSWQKLGVARDALEHELRDVLGVPERAGRETLSHRDSLIASSCRQEAARVAGLRDKAAA